MKKATFTGWTVLALFGGCVLTIIAILMGTIGSVIMRELGLMVAGAGIAIMTIGMVRAWIEDSKADKKESEEQADEG